MSGVSSVRPRCVVVTGVGAIIGQGIVRSLRRSEPAVRIVGIDRNAESMGPHLCDTFYAKPACEESSDAYVTFWTELLAREAIDLVLPGLEVDVFFLDAHREALSATTLGLNRSELIALARDKWSMGLELPVVGLQAIPSIISDDWARCVEALGSPPFLLKPREGNGSRGMARIGDEADLRYWTRKSGDNYLIQRIVGDASEEYTVGAFGLGDGDSLPPIVFRRLLSGAGNTQYAEVVRHEAIEAAVHQLSRYFRPLGPTNYQFRVDDGVPYLLEINPRLSSSTSLRAGFRL